MQLLDGGTFLWNLHVVSLAYLRHFRRPIIFISCVSEDYNGSFSRPLMLSYLTQVLMAHISDLDFAYKAKRASFMLSDIRLLN